MTTKTEIRSRSTVEAPVYLTKTYWWAYVHPRAVRFFERQWLVNLILWGNFGKLRDTALAALGPKLTGRTLQVACVYGDLTECLAQRLAPGSSLDVVDVLPIQLDNLARKLPPGSEVALIHGDSTALDLPTASYDRALVFFLLHEQPEAARRKTLAEALRVVRPGGELVIVDYHGPGRWNPMRLVMAAILRTLEPFAMDLWRHEITEWMPDAANGLQITKQTYFGGLYQLLKVRV